MIVPRVDHDRATVPAHYDALDRVYREVWGEHVHHGLWSSAREPPEVAVRRLVGLVADRAGLRPGMSVCDVGCGYGGTARILAREMGVEVTGVTVSAAQYHHARSRARPDDRIRYVLGDWLANDLPARSFDAVIAVESLSHMADKPAAFGECHRVLGPGGRLVVCDWLAASRPQAWERRLLLEPICREGRLPSMGSEEDYRGLVGEAGLRTESFEDLSRRVRRTWPICLGRLGRILVRDPAARRFLLSRRNPDRRFGLTMIRIPIAYRTGSMRYGILTARTTST